MQTRDSAKPDKIPETDHNSEEQSPEAGQVEAGLSVAGAIEPPPVQHTVNRLVQTRMSGERQKIFRSVGRGYGNRYASEVASRFIARQTVAGVIQRDDTAPAADGSTKINEKVAQPAIAQLILKSSYGSVKNIVQGQVVIVDNIQEMWKKHDEYCIANNKMFTKVKPSRAWQTGDSQVDEPTVFNGFRDRENNIVYVNKETTSPTTTVHEMLHNNSASGFDTTVGKTMNEGITQWLTVKALKAANVKVPADIPYQDELKLAEAMVKSIGEPAVIDAYFKDPDALVRIFEKLHPDTDYQKLLKAIANSQDTLAMSLMAPPSLETKKKVVDALFDWIVTNKNLSDIERIYKGASDSEKTELKKTIQNRIPDLSDLGDRGRMKLLIGA